MWPRTRYEDDAAAAAVAAQLRGALGAGAGRDEGLA
jgi:hypothetical protein